MKRQTVGYLVAAAVLSAALVETAGVAGATAVQPTTTLMMSAPHRTAGGCTGPGQCDPGGLSTTEWTASGNGDCVFAGTVDYGDGTTPVPVPSPSAGTSTTTVHQYTQPGTYVETPTLSATSPSGTSRCVLDVRPVTVEVGPEHVSAQSSSATSPTPTSAPTPTPTPSTTPTPTPLTSPTSTQTVTAALTATPAGATAATTTWAFDGSSSTAIPAATGMAYAWSFGDGSVDSGVSVSHAYSCAGVAQSFTTGLTVTATWSGTSQTSTVTVPVIVPACSSATVTSTAVTPTAVTPSTVTPSAVTPATVTTIGTPATATPPKAVNEEVAVPSSGTVTGNVMTHDSLGRDASGHPYSLGAQAGRPRTGRVTMSATVSPDTTAGTFRYTAPRRFCGVDAFSYHLVPASGRLPSTAAATVTLVVCGDHLPTFLQGLARQVLGSREPHRVAIARLLGQACATTATSKAEIVAAEKLERDPLLRQGMAFAASRLL